MAQSDYLKAISDSACAIIDKLNQTCVENPIKVDVCSNTSLVSLTKTHFRTTGTNTYSSPYRSLTVTAISSDVTIDGQAIPQGMTISVDSNENEVFTNNTIVIGTDYFVTRID